MDVRGVLFGKVVWVRGGELGSIFFIEVVEFFEGVLSTFSGEPVACGGMLMGRIGGGIGPLLMCLRSLLFCTLDAFLRFSRDVLLGEGAGVSFTFAFSWMFPSQNARGDARAVPPTAAISSPNLLATLYCTLFLRPAIVPNSDNGRGADDEPVEPVSNSCDDVCLCIRKGAGPGLPDIFRLPCLSSLSVSRFPVYKLLLEETIDIVEWL